jgi:hypothetical protein
MYQYELAESLHMTVAQLRVAMPASELPFWKAFHELKAERWKAERQAAEDAAKSAAGSEDA